MTTAQVEAMTRREVEAVIGAEERSEGSQIKKGSSQRIGGAGSSFSSDPGQRAGQRTSDLLRENDRKLDQILQKERIR